jgi:hypothetical protein
MNADDVNALIGQLKNFRTRSKAIKALVAVGEAAVEPLIAALEAAESQEGARWAVMQCLGQLRARSSVRLLAPYLEDTAYRIVAHRALVNIAGEDLGPTPEPWCKWAGAGVTASTPADGLEPEMHVTGLDDDRLVELALKDSGASCREERGGYVVVDVPLPQGRNQETWVNLKLKDHEGSSIVIVYADCGPASPEHYEFALKRNLKMPYGALAIRDSGSGPRFVMFNTLLRDALSPLELKKSIFAVGERAAQVHEDMQ